MTKQERLERFNELTRTYGTRELADMVIQLEEHCQKVDAEKAKRRATERAKLADIERERDDLLSELGTVTMDRDRMRDALQGATTCMCEVLDASEGGGTDERSCPEHAYEAGRRHERNVYLQERAELSRELDKAQASLAIVRNARWSGATIDDVLRVIDGTYTPPDAVPLPELAKILGCTVSHLRELLAPPDPASGGAGGALRGKVRYVRQEAGPNLLCVADAVAAAEPFREAMAARLAKAEAMNSLGVQRAAEKTEKAAKAAQKAKPKGRA